jgi:hypothetical protein
MPRAAAHLQAQWGEHMLRVRRTEPEDPIAFGVKKGKACHCSRELGRMAGVWIGDREAKGHRAPFGQIAEDDEWVGVKRLIRYPEPVEPEPLGH